MATRGLTNREFTLFAITWSGMSKKVGGDNATVIRALCVGYWYKMIEGIKTYKPEVKASKSDKRLRSYDHSKFCIFSYSFSLAHQRCRRLLNAAQTPTFENLDIPTWFPGKIARAWETDNKVCEIARPFGKNSGCKTWNFNWPYTYLHTLILTFKSGLTMGLVLTNQSA